MSDLSSIEPQHPDAPFVPAGPKKKLQPKLTPNIGGHNVDHVNEVRNSLPIGGDFGDFADTDDEGIDTPVTVVSKNLVIGELRNALKSYEKQLAALPRDQQQIDSKVDEEGSHPVNVPNLLNLAKKEASHALELYASAEVTQGAKRVRLVQQAKQAHQAAKYLEQAVQDLKQAYGKVTYYVRKKNDRDLSDTLLSNDDIRGNLLQQASDHYHAALKIMEGDFPGEDDINSMDGKTTDPGDSRATSPQVVPEEVDHEEEEELPTSEEFLEFAQQQHNLIKKVSTRIEQLKANSGENQEYLKRLEEFVSAIKEVVEHFETAAKCTDGTAFLEDDQELHEELLQMAQEHDDQALKKKAAYEEEYGVEIGRLKQEGVLKAVPVEPATEDAFVDDGFTEVRKRTESLIEEVEEPPVTQEKALAAMIPFVEELQGEKDVSQDGKNALQVLKRKGVYAEEDAPESKKLKKKEVLKPTSVEPSTEDTIATNDLSEVPKSKEPLTEEQEKASMTQEEALAAITPFLEKIQDDDVSQYENNALEQGANAEYVTSRKDYREKALAAYKEGDYDEAYQMAQNVKDSQQSIEYSLRSLKPDLGSERAACWKNLAQLRYEMIDFHQERAQHPMESKWEEVVEQGENAIGLYFQAEHAFADQEMDEGEALVMKASLAWDVVQHLAQQES